MPSQTTSGGLFLLAASSLLCAVSWDIDSLVVFRLAQAAGAAVIVSASLSVISLSNEPSLRPGAIAAWVTAQAIALAVAPLAISTLDPLFGWRSLFFAQVPICIGLAVALRRSSEQELQPPPSGFRLIDAIYISLLSVGVVVALGASDESRTTILLAVCAVSVLLALVGLVRSPMRGLWVEAFSPIPFRLPFIGLCTIGGVFFATFVTATTAVGKLGASSAVTVGLALLPLTIGIAAGAAVARRAIGFVPAAAIAAVSSLLTAIALLLISIPRIDQSVATSTTVFWLAMSFVVGAGVGGSMPMFNGLALGACSPGAVPVAGGLLQTGRQLGGALLAALVLRSGTSNERSAFLILAGFALAAALIGLVSGPARRPAEVRMGERT